LVLPAVTRGTLRRAHRIGCGGPPPTVAPARCRIVTRWFRFKIAPCGRAGCAAGRFPITVRYPGRAGARAPGHRGAIRV